MKSITTILFLVSFCYAKVQLPNYLTNKIKFIQNKYQINSNKNLSNLKDHTPNGQNQSTRDAEDLIGEWYVFNIENNAFITVGSDQSIPDPLSMIALVEGAGTVNASTTIPEVAQPLELNYFLSAGALDDGGDGDGEYTYGPRIGAYLTDLDPSSGGEVYFDNTDNEAVITFIDVPLFDNNDETQTFQIQLIYETGEIILSFLDLSLLGEHTETAPGGLAIGVANGSGEYTGIDLSGSPQIVSMNPIEGFSNDNQLDLENIKVTFTPGNANMFGYSVSTEPITELPGSYLNQIPLQDDGFLEQDLSSNFTFYGETYSMIYINNDGNIGFESGDQYCVCWFCDDGDGLCAASYLAGYAVEDDSRDDHTEYGSVMNMNFMEFSSLMMGESLGNISSPTIVNFGSSNDSEENIDIVNAMLFNGSEWIEFSLEEGNSSNVTLDESGYTFEFSNVVLTHEEENWTLTLNGNIGPELIELQAGIETELTFMGMMDSDSSGEETEMTFNSDGTGFEVLSEENGYSETTDFTYTTSGDDSLTLIYLEEDYYGNVDPETIGSNYYFIESESDLVPFDTLVLSGDNHLCDGYESDGATNYQLCLEEEGFSELLGEVEDVTSFVVRFEVYLIPAEYVKVDPLVNAELPNKYRLLTAYPNPFNPVTTIRFDLGENVASNTVLKIFDISGRLVATLLDERIQQGSYEIKWNASTMATGIYFTELSSGKIRETSKVVLMK